MNNVGLIGRLTSDPSMSYLQSGIAKTTFTLAVDKGLGKDKKAEMEQQGKATADFIRCIAFGKIAETAGNYLKKGKLAGITGSINTGSYEKDGKMVYTTDVLVSSIDILEWADKEVNPFL